MKRRRWKNDPEIQAASRRIARALGGPRITTAMVLGWVRLALIRAFDRVLREERARARKKGKRKAAPPPPPPRKKRKAKKAPPIEVVHEAVVEAEHVEVMPRPVEVTIVVSGPDLGGPRARHERLRALDSPSTPRDVSSTLGPPRSMSVLSSRAVRRD